MLMHLFSLVNPGLEKVAQQEIKELVKVKAAISQHALEFSVTKKEDLSYYFQHTQAARRVAIAGGKWSDYPDFDPAAATFPWSDCLQPSFSFKIEVEGVKGQENRFTIAKEIAGKLFSFLQKKGFTPTLELKKQDYNFLVYFTGEEYLFGLDCGGEMDSRQYRVFPHQATFKGDLAYYFVRQSGFTPKEKLLVGFVKDGGLAIEAALFANKIPLRNYPHFNSSTTAPTTAKKTAKTAVISFDPNLQNVVAARKNAQLAKVQELAEFHRYFLDELDTRFSAEEFDRIIIHLTKKDEDKINELYYQGNYVLKKGGSLFIITRGGLELPTPANYLRKQEQEVRRGESTYKWWVMRKR